MILHNKLFKIKWYEKYPIIIRGGGGGTVSMDVSSSLEEGACFLSTTILSNYFAAYFLSSQICRGYFVGPILSTDNMTRRKCSKKVLCKFQVDFEVSRTHKITSFRKTLHKQRKHSKRSEATYAKIRINFVHFAPIDLKLWHNIMRL